MIFGDGDKAYSGGDAAGAGNYDGAYVEGNNLGTAMAQGGNYLADILKFYGDGGTTTTAAAADLVGSDPSGALADGSAFWTELATLFLRARPGRSAVTVGEGGGR